MQHHSSCSAPLAGGQSRQDIPSRGIAGDDGVPRGEDALRADQDSGATRVAGHAPRARSTPPASHRTHQRFAESSWSAAATLPGQPIHLRKNLPTVIEDAEQNMSSRLRRQQSHCRHCQQTAGRRGSRRRPPNLVIDTVPCCLHQRLLWRFTMLRSAALVAIHHIDIAPHNTK